MKIDTIISAKWIVPIIPENTVLNEHSIALYEGKIMAILPSDEMAKKYPDIAIENKNNHLLMPGLINAHTHSPMNLFKGLADDLPLMEWLNNHIWPAESRWVSEHFVNDGSQLAMAEMIRSGTTCFNDMYFYPEVTARCADQVGLRAVVGMIVIDFPSAWAANTEEYISKGLAMHDNYRHHPLISTAFAPHAPYSVSDDSFSRIQTLADELDVKIHIHLHESDDEIQQSMQQYQCRPIDRLHKLGLVTPALTAVHMTHLTDSDISLASQAGISIIHCPESNLKLANGFCPVQQLLQKELNVAIGTDSASSNNDLDMLGEIKTAALIGKAVANSASALPAFKTLEMATLNGAKALGIDSITGSLEKGKSADIIAIDLDQIETSPLYNPLSQLVYSASRSQVTDVWVAGKQLLRNHQLMTLDENDLKHKAGEWCKKIAE